MLVLIKYTQYFKDEKKTPSFLFNVILPRKKVVVAVDHLFYLPLPGILEDAFLKREARTPPTLLAYC